MLTVEGPSFRGECERGGYKHINKVGGREGKLASVKVQAKERHTPQRADKEKTRETVDQID